MLRKFYCKKIIPLSILIIILFQSITLSQTGSIKGQVLDKTTNEPLFGANAIIEGTSLGAASDLYGNFVIRDIPSGNRTLKISYIGYEAITVNIAIPENKTLEENFYLEYKTLEGETVEVTAQAEGQLGAINQQLSSNTIANVVSKDRIKELPDVNAAETIGRLPGVSIERFGGEATKISIRGLSPKYNLITVNGVRIPSTGQEDRSVDLSLISSNMLDGIILKKANTPDMDADALGGTVDLRLKEAPERFQFSLSSQAGYSKLQDYLGNYNFSGSVSSRFIDNKLGVIANFNVDNYDRSADKFSAEYRPISTATEIGLQKLILREETIRRGRAGGSIFLDYHLSDGKITLNTFYNQLDQNQFNRINTLSLTAPGESNRHYYEIENRGSTTYILTGSAGVEQDFGWVHYDLGISRSLSNTDAPEEQTWRFNQEANAFNYYDFPAGTDPRIIPDSANVDTSDTRFAELWIWDTKRNENESSININFQVPLSISNDISGYIKVGGKSRWLDRMNDVEYHGRHGIQYGGSGNAMLNTLDRTYPEWGIGELVAEHGWLPISIFLDNYSRSGFLNSEYPLGFTVNQSMLEKVTQALDDSGYVLRYSINSLGSDYNGIERYQAGYIMGEFKLWKYFTLIPGIRYEQEYTRYNGWRFREITPNNIQGPPGELTRLTSTRLHEFWLPMVHLIIEPFDWMKIRLARTETLTRPDFLQFAPIARINSGQDYVRANNSKLKPSESLNYDASVSLYENHIGLLTFSGFYKEIKDLIFQTNYQLRTGIKIPEGSNIPESWRGSSPNTDLFINNPHKAYYRGFEVEWQTHFWYLPSFLNGLVLNVNYTRIFSEMQKWLPNLQRDSLINPPPFPVYSYKILDSSRTSRLPDQPAHILNLTLGYDLMGFSARVSFIYQTDKVIYIDRAAIFDSFTGSYSRWDLTLQQKIGWGLLVFANFSNLNNRPDERFRGDALVSPTYIEYYGFTMDLGVRYNFNNL